MVARSFNVRVFERKEREVATENPANAFNVDAPTLDRAAALAQAQLEGRGRKVLSVRHGPAGIVAVVSTELRTGPPPTVAPRVVAGRSRVR